MGSFRSFLIILWLALAAYTAVVISRHGLGLLPIFFGDVAKLGWPGQFNLDFLCFLVLSALWTAWRNGFSAIALLLALIAFFGGAGFLLPYLVFLTVQERGNMPRVLIGARTRKEMSLTADDERDGISPSSNELRFSRRRLAGCRLSAFGSRSERAALYLSRCGGRSDLQVRENFVIARETIVTRDILMLPNLQRNTYRLAGRHCGRSQYHG
ncbi:hypothetical protein V6U71_13520 [Sphingopyxis sp. J-6]|uniref:hypothetical protein n=2 Tax=unclassified Sphingopyxis TaxID=2614943 RepID=UPI003983F772